MLVDFAGGTAEHGQRYEHGNQHGGNADHGAGNLPHGFMRGFTRWQAFFRHDAFHVFHHHNGVVHHNTDYQHHGKHSQYVDRHAEIVNTGKAAQERNRHHDSGNQGVADVLQEHKHHNEHQHHGFHQGVYHLFDGDFHEGGGVVWGIPSNIAGEVLLQFGHAFFYQRGSGGGVAAVGQHHGHADGGFAIEAGTGGVVFRTQLDFGHIAQINVGTVCVAAQDDVAEFFRRAELAVGSDGGGNGLPLAGWQRAERTGRNLHVLCTDGGGNVGKGEIEVLQFLRVYPNTHGAFCCKQTHCAHAFNTLQFGHDVAFGIVGHFFQILGLRRECHHHQEVGAGFGYVYTVLLHGSRQAGQHFVQFVVHFQLRHAFIGIGSEGKGNAT